MKKSNSKIANQELHLSWIENIFVSTCFKFFHLGLYHLLPEYDGDYPNMSLLDKVFWLYKKDNPLVHKRKISDEVSNKLSKGDNIFEIPVNFCPSFTANISAVGDIIPMENIEKQSRHIYEDVFEDLLNVDFSFANLEAPVNVSDRNLSVKKKNKQPPLLYFSLLQLDYLIKFRGRTFSAFSTINNHTMDFGIDGVLETVESVKHHGVIHLGTYVPKKMSDNRFQTVDINGINVGLIAFSFGLNGNKPTDDYKNSLNVVNLNRPYSEIDLSSMKKAILDAKESGCDFIILSLHWGLEFEFFPTKHQVKVAHDLAEMGVDLILGHHPHVIQPIEKYQTKRDPSRFVPICYSLGNLTTPVYSTHECLSLLVKLKLVKGTINNTNKTYIEKCEILPLILIKFDKNDSDEYRIKKLDDIFYLKEKFENCVDLEKIYYYTNLILS
ncbi:MAG: CapA family protein [Cyanobacterium sp.]